MRTALEFVEHLLATESYNPSSPRWRKLIYANEAELREHFYAVMGYPIRKSGCTKCDRLSEALAILRMKLRTTNTDTMAKTNTASRSFELRAGKLLHDPVNNAWELQATARNLTDELALYHLAHKPEAAVFFSVLPADWEKQVEEYKKAHPELGLKAAASAKKAKAEKPEAAPVEEAPKADEPEPEVAPAPEVEPVEVAGSVLDAKEAYIAELRADLAHMIELGSTNDAIYHRMLSKIDKRYVSNEMLNDLIEELR